MEVSFRDLNGEYECERRRARKLNMQDMSTPVMQFAHLQKETAKQAIRMDIAVSDIRNIINEGAKNIDFKSEITRELKAGDASKRIERLVNSVLQRVLDKNNPCQVVLSPDAKDITINTKEGDVIITGVRPDMVLIYGDHMEGYFFRIGKAQTASSHAYKKEDANRDKQLYALLKYLEQMVPAGRKCDITAGFAFFRKGSDKNASLKTKAHFDLNFFVDEQMNQSDNIVCISESYVGGSTMPQTIDKNFEPWFEQYVHGIAPEDCTEEQCANCQMNRLCHYEHSPMCLEELEKTCNINAISLSPTQEKIELFQSGYAVVNAVPGAGKTLILVLRIINLLLNGVKPEEIVIITFTNSGAEVFKNRIAQYNDDVGTGEDVSNMMATTFNGLGQFILEKEYQYFGFDRAPRVIDPIERYAIIAELLKKHYVQDLDYRNFSFNSKNCKGPLAVASKVFELMKSKGYTVYDADTISSEVGRGFCTVEAARELAEMYDEYNQYLREAALVEYADQEMMILELLEKDPYYFDKYGWKHILVDECQDTSENQFRLLKYMTNSPSFESLMVVGDDSQSIYGFRDTSPKFFMNFESVMGLPKGSAVSFYMTDNFRSTPEIVDFANQIVQKNVWKVVKDIVATNTPGAPVQVKGFIESSEEYEWIVKCIREHIDNGVAPEDIAFIAYSKTELMKMADLLTMEDIPSVMLNPESLKDNSRVQAGLSLAKCFQDASDVKDIYDCLNASMSGDLLTYPDDIINGMAEAFREKIQAIKALPEPEFKKQYFELLETFDENDEVYQSFVKTLQGQPTMAQVFTYCNNFDEYGNDAAHRREHSYPGVVLTTAHSSKGMEWKVVINSLSKYDTPELHTRNAREQEEERRRLLFVSATRAREELYITGKYVAYGPSNDRHYNMFLKEACDIVGEEFDATKISAEYYRRAKEKREKREAEKKRLTEELLAKAEEKRNGEKIA